ncbi:MAG: T9SS type A sorting domain-containing protein [Tannerella sp.]|nr:T9SS type A sorting domain-containing protein [Tannerella sp.]
MTVKKDRKKRIGGFFAACLWLLLTAAAAGGAPQRPDRYSAPENQVKITVTDNRIAVAYAPAGSVMEIYNVIGVKVQSIQLRKPSGEYVITLPKGYYIVRIGVTVRKIVIR